MVQSEFWKKIRRIPRSSAFDDRKKEDFFKPHKRATLLDNFIFQGTIHKRRLSKGGGRGVQKMPKKETFTSRFEETRGGRMPQKSKIWGDVFYGWSLRENAEKLFFFSFGHDLKKSCLDIGVRFHKILNPVFSENFTCLSHFWMVSISNWG